MANAPDTVATQEIFKKVYAEGVINQVPESGVFQRAIQFDNQNKIGDEYIFALMLRWPQGTSWNGGSNYGKVQTLNDARPGLTKQAKTKGCEFLIREQISYGSISKGGGGAQSFDPMTDLMVKAVVEASSYNLELMLTHGGGSMGAVGTNTPGAGTTSAIVISVATWAPGIWTAYEGAALDCYDSTLTTKQNTDGPVIIDSIDIDARTLNVTFASAGDRTACTAGDLFVPLGAFGNWLNGIIPTLTTSAAGGSVYGITTSDYGLLRAGTYDAGGAALTFAKCANAAIASVQRGGMGDLTTYVSHYAWTDINNDEAGNRRYTDDYGGEFVNGADKLTYYGPNGGKLEIMPHPMMKAGEAVMINNKDWKRIGSSEPTFELPNRDPLGNPMFLLDRQDQNALEFRRWWDQSGICTRLGRQVLITNITNTSGPA